MRTLRPLASTLVRHRFDVTVRHADRFPHSGPVVVAANHIGVIDGPLMAAMSPRPVHAMTKHEMFAGLLGMFLHGAGQVPVHRHQSDPIAVRTCLRLLRDGGVLGVFPEGTRGAGALERTEAGAAYFAIATGAPVVPLAFLGTREPGGSLNSVPAKGTRMVMSYGEPLTFGAHGWPRRKPEVRAAAEEIRAALLLTLREAESATGLSLPGPVPPTREKEAL